MFAWFFLSALYLQRVLGYGPMKVGLAFLPANLIMAAFSISLSAKTVERFGIRAPLAAGLAISALGLSLFAMAPLDGRFWLHVVPAMSLLGLGAGLADNPVILAALNDVDERDSGLASGLLNTSFMMGGALGLAVLASLAATRTSALSAEGAPVREALHAGYRLAFAIAAAAALAAAALGAILLQSAPAQRSLPESA
jgi:MFS family permease